jgi:hypothetical protein
MKLDYTIGCDPELFVVNNGLLRSAHDLLPGSKFEPHRVSKGAVQPDGTSAEFNIDPARSVTEFCTNIRSVLIDLQRIIQAKDPGFTLRVVPTAHFDYDYFKTLPQGALEFGCMPDFNAWTGEMNLFNGTTKPMRTGAGHVHVGWSAGENVDEPAHLFDCREAVKQLDASVYLMSLLWDKDSERRELYGKIGAFRPKHYGVEYRSVSNAWVADPDLHVWIFNATLKAMELLDDKNPVRLWEDKDIRDMVEDSRAGVELAEADLIAVHDILSQGYGLPALPGAYTKPLPF